MFHCTRVKERVLNVRTIEVKCSWKNICRNNSRVCRVTGMLRWFSHVERMESDKIAMRVYIGESAGSHSVGRLQKRWIDTVKEFKEKRKRGLVVRQARRMMQDRSEWQGFVKGNAWGVAQGMNPWP